MQEYEEKKSEEVLKLIFEHRTEIKQTKRSCVYRRSTGTHGFFIYRIYTTRQVFNKKQYKGIALKCQKQYNIIGKNLVLLLIQESGKTQFKIMKMEG